MENCLISSFGGKVIGRIGSSGLGDLRLKLEKVRFGVGS